MPCGPEPFSGWLWSLVRMQATVSSGGQPAGIAEDFLRIAVGIAEDFLRIAADWPASATSGAGLRAAALCSKNSSFVPIGRL